MALSSVTAASVVIPPSLTESLYLGNKDANGKEDDEYCCGDLRPSDEWVSLNEVNRPIHGDSNHEDEPGDS